MIISKVFRNLFLIFAPKINLFEEKHIEPETVEVPPEHYCSINPPPPTATPHRTATRHRTNLGIAHALKHHGLL